VSCRQEATVPNVNYTRSVKNDRNVVLRLIRVTPGRAIVDLFIRNSVVNAPNGNFITPCKIYLVGDTAGRLAT